MTSNAEPNKKFNPQSQGLRHACRNVLRNAQTANGRYVPLTIPEIAAQLTATGLEITERDVEGFVRELEAAGEVVEIDAQAGFRWAGSAA